MTKLSEMLNVDDNRNNKMKLLSLYSSIKSLVIESGFNNEINWQENTCIDSIDERYFIREAAWVILSSGMKETIIRRLFVDISEVFFNWSQIDILADVSCCRRNALKIFNHRKKINAIIYIIRHVHKNGFEFVLQSLKERNLSYLLEFPYMGPATSYHFAKNLGMDVVKPDRHLLRISSKLGFDSPFELCKEVSSQTGDKISVIDLIFWRYATLDKNYLSNFKALML